MRMKTVWLIFVLSLLIGAPLRAQEADTTALADLMNDALPALSAEFHHVPGFAVAIIKDGAVIWSGGYGVADVEAQTPVSASTPFPTASISKVVTAYAALGLAADGVIDLDAPVNGYLTRWQVPVLGRNNADDVTVRRILSHTAGLSAEGYRGFAPGDSLPTLEAFLDGAGGDPVRVMIRPGVRFMYSGGGYTVLQLLIEELTGVPFADYMHTSVFEPLGMEHASFVWTPDLGAAAQYDVNGNVQSNTLHMDQAAGGLYASADDLGAFFAALLEDERSEAIFTAADATDGAYGFGVYIDQTQAGDTMIWHDGLGRGMHAAFYLFPEHNEGVIVLANTPTGNAVVNRVLCLYDGWSAVEAAEFCE